MSEMKQKLVIVLAVIFILSSCGYSNPQGHLFIIGGGSRPESMMKKFIDLAEKSGNKKIIILPMASSAPDEAGPGQAQQLRDYGAQNVEFHILTREQALDEASIKILDGVGGVYFSGGSQSRLAGVLRDTPFLEKLHAFYKKGGVIGGSSAGAAVMSEVMITGDEKRDVESGREFSTIQADNIVTVKGFSFVTSAIIDQHFVRRKRHNRLISLVLEYPKLLGIGIGESTAIIVAPDQTFEVLGQRNVIIYDAYDSEVDLAQQPPVSSHNMRMHILKSGDRFSLENRDIIKQQ
jgi:cyanophycinase